MKSPTSILVLQLKRIGDLVLTTPALRSLRAAHPNASITLVVDAACQSLLPVLDMVDHVRVFKRGRLNAGLWAGVTSGRYDVCLDFTGNDRSASLCILSRARRRIGFERVRKSGLRAFAYNAVVASSVRERHTIDHYLDLVAPVTDGHLLRELTLTPPAANIKTTRALLESAGVTGPYAVLHPGTARAEKYWVPERWASVADTCHSQYGFAMVLTGGTDPMEQAHLAAIRSAMKTPVTDLSGRSDLCTLLALIAGARLLLGVDSAAMHFAAASGTPLVALFGLTNPFHWQPGGPDAAIVHANQKNKEPTPRHHKAPMTDIPVERVLEAVTKLIPPKALGLL